MCNSKVVLHVRYVLHDQNLSDDENDDATNAEVTNVSENGLQMASFAARILHQRRGATEERILTGTDNCKEVNQWRASERASGECLPIASASPCLHVEPEKISSPITLSAGSDSPVSAASSMETPPCAAEQKNICFVCRREIIYRSSGHQPV